MQNQGQNLGKFGPKPGLESEAAKREGVPRASRTRGSKSGKGASEGDLAFG